MTLRTRKLLAYGAAIAMLLAVFALYARPEIMVTLSDAIWACFSIVR
jgi:hypothetical protein